MKFEADLNAINLWRINYEDIQNPRAKSVNFVTVCAYKRYHSVSFFFLKTVVVILGMCYAQCRLGKNQLVLPEVKHNINPVSISSRASLNNKNLLERCSITVIAKKY